MTANLREKLIWFDFRVWVHLRQRNIVSKSETLTLTLEQMYNAYTWHDYKWIALIVMSILEKNMDDKGDKK